MKKLKFESKIDMNLFAEIKKLNFPLDQYIVVGSGPIVARGLRMTNDVDIVVTPELFEKCKTDGWDQVPWTYEKVGQIYLKKGNAELYLDVNCKDFNPTFIELRSRADIIQGIPFASLEDTKQFKKAYGKSKHLKDIKLIEEYQRSDINI